MQMKMVFRHRHWFWTKGFEGQTLEQGVHLIADVNYIFLAEICMSQGRPSDLHTLQTFKRDGYRLLASFARSQPPTPGQQPSRSVAAVASPVAAPLLPRCQRFANDQGRSGEMQNTPVQLLKPEALRATQGW